MSAPDPARLGGTGEVTEDEASGAVLDSYTQLRTALGVPFIPTVYRIAATHEGVFLKAVRHLAPFLSLQRKQHFSQATERIARQALASPSPGPSAIALDVQSSLLVEQYATANPLNLLFVLCLLGTDVVERSSVMTPPLPPLSADIHSDIFRCHGGAIMPGFWRELGSRPEVLEMVWSATREHAEEAGFNAARKAVLNFATETVREAGVDEDRSYISPQERRQLDQLLGWFPTGIATMISEIEWLKTQAW